MTTERRQQAEQEWERRVRDLDCNISDTALKAYRAAFLAGAAWAYNQPKKGDNKDENNA